MCWCLIALMSFIIHLAKGWKSLFSGPRVQLRWWSDLTEDQCNHCGVNSDLSWHSWEAYKIVDFKFKGNHCGVNHDLNWHSWEAHKRVWCQIQVQPLWCQPRFEIAFLRNTKDCWCQIQAFKSANCSEMEIVWSPFWMQSHQYPIDSNMSFFYNSFPVAYSKVLSISHGECHSK